MPSPNHRKIMSSLAGIVSNRLCTIPIKHLSANMRKKHQDWFDPNDQILRDLLAKRDQAHQRVLQIKAPDPLSKLTKMHAEYYRNIHELESLNGGK